MKKTYAFLTAGICLVAIGLAMGYGLLWQNGRSTHQTASPFLQTAHAATAAPKPAQVLQGTPVRIQIPSLKIDLQVIPGLYNRTSKTWTLTKNKAQYATITPPANNQAGNTFIYGHNRAEVFASLLRIKPGALVTLTTDNQHTFTYRYRASVTTNPNDDSLFHYQGPPILTVQTCSGAWYQNRQLFVFDLVSAT